MERAEGDFGEHAREMAAKMAAAFQLTDRAATGYALAMAAAFYIDQIVGGSEEIKREGVALLERSIRNMLFQDPLTDKGTN